MRICYLANSASSHTKKWADYFVSLGHEVHVISHSNVDIPGAQIHYINYSLKNFPFMALKVHRKIREINPDILHAHQANTCGLYAASAKGYDYILSTWGSDVLVGPERSFILKKIAQYDLKKASFITSDSYHMSSKILELGGIKDRIYTFPMGIEDEHIKEKHEFNVNEDNLNIISIRRLEKMFRVDVIIRGFCEALKEKPNMFLTVAADGSEMDSLVELVDKLGIRDKVKFTGSYKPHEVGKLLSDNDVFVSIPESDSTSVSLLESMYCGLFPVVCGLPANREWVRNGENGLVIDEVNEINVKNALLWCCENKQHMDRVSHENIDIIEKRALWKNNSRIVEDLYNMMLKKKL
ncbi:MAG: glycosyltransferase family 4 protein [Clostridiales bacterium]|jgi:glycosyltransferase involved in cell wall biosynthesis|nr:glycosyltransferase family 4 protein [Clostridiales bacterium]